MLARIEAALDHERAFLDDASHELRTPIAIARGELELARPLANDSPAVAVALESALEEVEQLQVMAVNLLDLARTRAAGPPPETTVDLRAVCADAIDSVRRARTTDPVAVSLSGEASTVGDAAALTRAVTNLVDNAVRHAGHEVTVALGHPNGTSVVEVRDDGPGFPSEVVDHVGARFIPGAHGAGLGLAIVEAIAGAHGGRLELSNADDGASGAIARLELHRRSLTAPFIAFSPGNARHCGHASEHHDAPRRPERVSSDPLATADPLHERVGDHHGDQPVDARPGDRRHRHRRVDRQRHRNRGRDRPVVQPQSTVDVGPDRRE